MKKTVTYKSVLLLLFVWTVEQGNMVAHLNHICAYSNESVAKFRKTTLKNIVAHSLSHPGIRFDWPIDVCDFWISSLYGMRKGRMHNGVDMAALTGTNVKAAADGVVVSLSKSMKDYGNMIDIQHAGGKIVTRYAHLDKILVVVGQKVKIGQIIGKVGSTGNVQGVDPSHLHFELFYNGVRMDPLKYLYSAEIDYKNLRKKNIMNK